MIRYRASEQGVTLVEITVVLMVVAILTSAAAPIASRTIERARLSRAITDMQAIRTALSTFIIDIPASFRGPKIDASGAGNATTNEVDMLVSDGDIPPLGAGHANWLNPVSQSGAMAVDFLENHIVKNIPYAGAIPLTNLPYATGGWHGAYINGPLDPDPWGNRYMVNTEWLEGTVAERRNDTFVLTAGPNELTDTQWTMDGAVAGDDDMIVIVRRGTGELVP